MADLGKFVHLHLHSQYSLLDGACRFDPLCARVTELGMGAVALTDHGNLFGALQFHNVCREHGVKPIIGCEVYVSPTDRRDKRSAEGRRNQHFILLAESDEGYRNLARLTSLAYIEGFYRKPRIDKEILAEHRQGLIGLSACLKGVVADYLMRGDFKAAQSSIDDYTQILGPGNFYLEVMDHGLEPQKRVNEGILELAAKNDLPLVASNDCHYLLQDDHMLREVVQCIRTAKRLDDPNRLRFEVNEFYLKTPDQMIDLFGHLKDAVKNTVRLAERCNVVIETGRKLLPKFAPPDGKTAADYLTELAREGLARRYNGRAGKEHSDRLDFELQIIHSMGFDSYFLIVWDFIHFAKSQAIPVGPGRGSGAGSFVAYCLAITDIDPIEHGLIFERFLNPERVSLPDFDIDLCRDRRCEVIDYVRNKYGERNVAQIITFGSMKAKAALKDVGRVLGMSIAEVDRVAKMVPFGPKVTLGRTLEENADLRRLCNENKQVAELMAMARRIEGSVRHPSTHAAGIVIADEDLTRLIPIYVDSREPGLITQFAMKEVESIGLLKMDFLGLKNLTIIDKTLTELKRARGVRIEWRKIPLDDARTYQLLQSGDALGLFQLESAGMRELLIKLKPDKFSDLVALISLFRPGPMEIIPEFIDRRHGRREIVYDHPLLEPILRETYGLIVYQEQVMQIAQRLAGFSLGRADILRRAMGKKHSGMMNDQRDGFMEGCRANDIDEALADRIFRLIEKFAQYGFNKSHAAAYAMVAFQTAYLKAHYPVEFMAELMSADIGSSDSKLGTYIASAAAMGVDVLPPDVLESRDTFTVVGRNIRFGLQAIKNVGGSLVEASIAERESGGPFKSMQNFVSRMAPNKLNVRALECLVKCGAFDGFGHNRPSLLAVLPSVMEQIGSARKDDSGAQSSLFEMMSAEEMSNLSREIPIPFVEDWPQRVRLEYEKELTGHFLSGHPLRQFEADFEAFADYRAPQIQRLEDGVRLTWLGMISAIRHRTQKKDGRTFASLTCEDMEGSIEVMLFADAFAKYRDLLREGAILWMRGSVNHWNDKVSLRIDELKTTDEVRRKRVRALAIEIPARQVTEASMTELSAVFARHKGRRPVRIIVTENGSSVAVQTGRGFTVSPSDRFIQELQQTKIEKKLTYLAE